MCARTSLDVVRNSVSLSVIVSICIGGATVIYRTTAGIVRYEQVRLLVPFGQFIEQLLGQLLATLRYEVHVDVGRCVCKEVRYDGVR